MFLCFSEPLTSVFCFGECGTRSVTQLKKSSLGGRASPNLIHKQDRIAQAQVKHHPVPDSLTPSVCSASLQPELCWDLQLMPGPNCADVNGCLKIYPSWKVVLYIFIKELFWVFFIGSFSLGDKSFCVSFKQENKGLRKVVPFQNVDQLELWGLGGRQLLWGISIIQWLLLAALVGKVQK